MTLEDKPGLVFAGVDHGDQSPLCLTAPAFAAGCCHLRCDGGAAHLGRECLGYMDTHSDYYSPLCRIDLVSSRCFHDLRGDASTRAVAGCIGSHHRQLALAGSQFIPTIWNLAQPSSIRTGYHCCAGNCRVAVRGLEYIACCLKKAFDVSFMTLTCYQIQA